MVRRAIILILLLFGAAVVQGQEIKVTLLGTGSPSPSMTRFGPSILIEAGQHRFLFDAGRGALQRLVQVGVRWQDVDGVFLTHLHSDHVVGFPDLWLTRWLTGAGRSRPLRVWGPQGTKRMMSHLEQAYEFDIRMRLDDEASAKGVILAVEDIGEGVSFDEDGLRITAFEVDHQHVKPAFGYRVDYRGRSVVLSGDTRMSENLIRHAEGVDLLIHEVVAPEALRRAGFSLEKARGIAVLHATPEEAGEVFSRAKPRLAVYSHIVLPTANAEDLIPATRKTYSGPLEVGVDLMQIDVGERIEVRRPSHSSP